MSVAITDDLRAKIERRSRRAWRHHRRGDDQDFSRITDVTERTLLYRIPDGPPSSQGWYGKKKLKVSRKNGEITVEVPPRDALLDLRATSDLWKLKDHCGRVRAYKYTNKEGKSPTYPTPEITWKLGAVIEVQNASTDKNSDCDKGINLGTYAWCFPSVTPTNSHRLFAVEFEIEDLAAVPNSTDGKFRVFRCTVVEELFPHAKAKPKAPPTTPSGPQPDDPLLDVVARRKKRKDAAIKRAKKRAHDPTTTFKGDPIAEYPLNIDKKLNERPSDKLPEQKLLPAKIEEETPKKKGFWDRFWRVFS